ncbi:Oidioi.mRNA.OKI2018_I69.XSR.g14592.t1.cds [Oikopleura dioica]|uniref:Oidioi.mRNA.OKI2018_I69.XSR.g14592.t1.cds n=1 Tax=Oikopleura dioica TaxID=34765 RepID=A0ABN7SA96_OIKDI|nr:Oidioi.mRNA.OKI2018_I69.XSR.g14592.t1.cds [Oikopleura dioica]
MPNENGPTLEEKVIEANPDQAFIDNIIRGFGGMLNELRVNSRPHLTTLAILAGEYRAHADQIVDLIEQRLREAPKYRIPVLYLIDHIIKDFPDEYVHHFSTNLVKLFAETFRHSSPDPDRKKLYELRTTWDDVFPPRILYELDSTVKNIDKKWPVRVVKSERSSRTPHSQSSDEFSHSETESETRSSRSRHRQIADEDARKAEEMLNGGASGAGLLPNNNADQTRTRTPSSVSSPNNLRSRPPSTVSEDAPKSTTALDERLSMIERASRAQSREDSDSDDNALVISTPPPTKIKEKKKKTSSNKLKKAPSAGRVSHPSSGISSPVSQFTSLSAHKSRGLNEILNGLPNRRTSILERPGAGAQQTSSTGVITTTRAIQTSQYTRDMAVLTEPVGKKDASTQKKLRKPKQAHFGHQFSQRAFKVAAGVQATRSTKDAETQYLAGDSEDITLSRDFESRAMIYEYLDKQTKSAKNCIMSMLLNKQMYDDPSCDLTLVCSDGQLKAHKIILAVVSDYVASESCMSNEVHIPKLGTSHLQKMINYIYRQFYGPFENNDDVADFVKGVGVLKIRMLDATVASLKEGIQQGKSYKSYYISGTEIQSPDLLRSAMAAQVTPQASDLDDDALMAIAEEIVVPEDKKNEKRVTPKLSKADPNKENTPTARTRRSRAIIPPKDSDDSSGPEDRNAVKSRVLKKRKQEPAKPSQSEERSKRFRKDKTPDRASETPSRPQRSRSRVSQPVEDKPTPKRQETPKGRPSRREAPKTTSPKIEDFVPESFKFLSHVKLDESEVKAGQKQYPQKDLDTQTESTSKRSKKSKEVISSDSESDGVEPAPPRAATKSASAPSINTRPKRRLSRQPQTEETAKEDRLSLAAQVVVKQEPPEKATPSRATRVSLRASRAQKSNPEESSKDADEKLPTPVPPKSETRSTRSKSPAIAALKKEVDLSQIKKEYISPNTVIKLEAGLVESPKPLLPELDEENSDEIKEENEEETVETEIKPEKPKTEGRATRRRTMPAISKSVKPVATRAPSTPKPQPTRQTQNKFKLPFTTDNYPVEVEEKLKMPTEEFIELTGYLSRSQYLEAYLRSKL